MSKILLRSLRVTALRSFAETSSVSFPEAGMTLFRGKNLDSGGSSGSGKSSVLLAIAYLLGHCRFPATQLQSWLTEEPLEVEGVLVDGESEMVVTRGASGLRLVKDGQKVSGSAKNLEAKLTEFVGLTPELLAALTYRGQKQPGLFLSKTDAEKKEFLTELLDLKKFEVQAEETVAKIKVAAGKLMTADGAVSAAQETVNSMRQRLIDAPPKIQDLKKLEEEAASLLTEKSSLETLLSEHNKMLAKHQLEFERGLKFFREEAQAAQEPLEERVHELENTPEEHTDRSAIDAVESDIAAAKGFIEEEKAKFLERQREAQITADGIQTQIQLLTAQIAQKPSIDAQRKKAHDAKLKALAVAACPTCERPWDTTALVEDLAAQIEQFDEALLEIEQARPKAAALVDCYNQVLRPKEPEELLELQRILTQLEQQRQTALQEYAVQRALSGEVLKSRRVAARLALSEAKQAAAQAATDREAAFKESMQPLLGAIDDIKGALSVAASRHTAADSVLRRAKMDNEAEERRVAGVRQYIDDAEKVLSKRISERDQVAAVVKAEEDFQRLIGREGFLGSIFDEVLNEISEETNQLLAQFPNTSRVALYFRSEVTSQKGAISKKITPFVSVNGFDTPLASGLSGGMETAVELAVDLAVAQVVSRRTGTVPGWLVLDESFTGLGPVESEACMEILKVFAQDKLVLVVDHASEFKAMFDQHITVEYAAGKSKVVP